MVFEVVEPKQVWCVHYWDMKICSGTLLGTETEEEGKVYVRFEGEPINKINLIDGGNTFDTENAAEKALFKANLGGKKRERLYHDGFDYE